MCKSRLLFLCFIGITLAPAMTLGHSLSTSQGGIQVRRNVIFVSVSINYTDILHYASRSPDDLEKLSDDELKALAEKYSPQIAEELVMRDGDGRRINNPELMKISLHAPTVNGRKNLSIGMCLFSFQYKLTEPVAFLTLQQRFFSTGPPHNSQLSMSVEASGFEADSAHVILTNRGNTATVAIEWPVVAQADMDRSPTGAAGSPAIVPPRVEANPILRNLDQMRAAPKVSTPLRFSSVMGQLWITDKEIVQEIDLPLPLLETWMTLKRGDADFVNGDELSVIDKQLRSLVEGKNPLKVDGKVVTPQIIASGFLGPDETELSATPTTLAVRGYYITRAAVRLRYPLASPAKKVEFEWQLFNNAILDAELELHVDGKMTGHTLTKYAPTITWERP